MKSIVSFIKRNIWIGVLLLIAYIISFFSGVIWSWFGDSYFHLFHGLLGTILWSTWLIADYDLESKRFKSKLALVFHLVLVLASIGAFGLGLMGVLAWL